MPAVNLPLPNELQGEINLNNLYKAYLDLFDTNLKLRKELTFLMQNLDGENVLFAQKAKIAEAFISELVVGDNVSMGPNAYISWGNVTSPPFIPTTAGDVGALSIEDYESFVNTYNSDIDYLQGQIDGVVSTYFYDYEPTLANIPAVEWTTDTIKDEHIGDLFYDTVTGYSYRFLHSSGVYSWTRITDTDITKALADAARAQDTADHKRRVFTTIPTPPYDVGDLWAEGASGELRVCKTQRLTGSYMAADWELATKYNLYTDLMALNKINATYIDANGVWTPSVYATNISVLNGKILTAQIEDLIVGGNVTMGSNASISWDKVTSKPTIPSTAADVGALPVSTYIPTLPDYLQSTYIDATQILSPTIIGGTLKTAEDGSRVEINSTTGLIQYNSSGKALLKISPIGASNTGQIAFLDYTDLGYARMTGVIQADLATFEIFPSQAACMKLGEGSKPTYTYGTWVFAGSTLNFANTTIQNLNITAKFG